MSSSYFTLVRANAITAVARDLTCQDIKFDLTAKLRRSRSIGELMSAMTDAIQVEYMKHMEERYEGRESDGDSN